MLEIVVVATFIAGWCSCTCAVYVRRWWWRRQSERIIAERLYHYLPR